MYLLSRLLKLSLIIATATTGLSCLDIYYSTNTGTRAGLKDAILRLDLAPRSTFTPPSSGLTASAHPPVYDDQTLQAGENGFAVSVWAIAALWLAIGSILILRDTSRLSRKAD